MTHPLTPREKVAALKTNDPTNPAHRLASDLQAGHFAAGASRDDLIEVLSNLPRYAALVSGSGDHAELERLADRNVELSVLAYKWMEAHDALKSGQPYDYPSPADVPTLLAENAALRAENTEAERKLVEADKCARSIVAMEIPPGNDPEQRLKLLSLLAKAQVIARTFLSKEAERG